MVCEVGCPGSLAGCRFALSCERFTVLFSNKMGETVVLKHQSVNPVSHLTLPACSPAQHILCCSHSPLFQEFSTGYVVNY